jgi:hypothetical protein
MLTIINHYMFRTFRKRNGYVLIFKSDHCYVRMKRPLVGVEERGALVAPAVDLSEIDIL